MNRLLAYLKNYRRESVLGPLFKLIEASFELLVPLVMAAIIDRGILGGDAGMIARMGAVLIGLGLAGLLCSLTAQFFAAKAAVGAATAMRQDLFHHIQRLGYPELDHLGASTMITRMTSDIQQVQSGINLTLRLFLRSPFIVFGAMAMAFTVDTQAAWVFVVAIPVLALVVFGIMALTMPLYRRVQGALDKVTGKTRENLTGARVVRAFAREQAETEEFDQRNERLTAMQKKVGRISALMNPLTYLLINLALIALIWVGALRVDGGAITQGAVVALVSYMSQILVELIKLANLIITMTRSLACWGRVRDMLDTPVSIQEKSVSEGAAENAGPAVCFEQVSLTYPGAGAPALSQVSFCAGRGQTVGVIGGTGSGKTSLVNLIPRFYEVTGGRVLVDGRDVRAWAQRALRGQIGLVPQKAALFGGTVRENMRWGKADASDEEIVKALKRAQAWEFVKDKPGGLDFVIEPRGRNLSGGQRQRLTIARALVRQPHILILDDSASALDFATDARLRAAIREMPGGATVFIVSQRASSIQYADLILVLDDGRVVGQGTHEQLMRDCQVYQEIYSSQFPKEAV